MFFCALRYLVLTVMGLASPRLVAAFRIILEEMFDIVPALYAQLNVRNDRISLLVLSLANFILNRTRFRTRIFGSVKLVHLTVLSSCGIDSYGTHMLHSTLNYLEHD